MKRVNGRIFSKLVRDVTLRSSCLNKCFWSVSQYGQVAVLQFGDTFMFKKVEEIL